MQFLRIVNMKFIMPLVVGESLEAQLRPNHRGIHRVNQGRTRIIHQSYSPHLPPGRTERTGPVTCATGYCPLDYPSFTNTRPVPLRACIGRGNAGREWLQVAGCSKLKNRVPDDHGYLRYLSLNHGAQNQGKPTSGYRMPTSLLLTLIILIPRRRYRSTSSIKTPNNTFCCVEPAK